MTLVGQGGARYRIDREVAGEMVFFGFANDQTGANRKILEALQGGAPYACQHDLAPDAAPQVAVAGPRVTTMEQGRL